MQRRIIYFLLSVASVLFLLFLSGKNVSIHADSSTPSPTQDASQTTSSISECASAGITVDKCPSYLQGKLDQLAGQEKTLSSQIKVMDTQINVTQARIYATEQQINELTLDIDTASKKIDDLQVSVDSQTKALMNRVVATYEVGSIQPMQVLLTSSTVADFLKRLNYLKIAQEHDKKALYNMEQAKNDYQNQKNIYQDKKAQVEALKAQLEAYTDQLNQEKSQKQLLLTQTQGSEATYQQLVAEAQAQLAAFSGFVTSQGGVTLITADPNWPSNYFSQRDTRWGNVNIAGYYSSPSNVTTIGASGCLISSVAMTLSKRGNNTTPLAIGTNGSYFFDANFQWSSLNNLGFNTPVRTLDHSLINNSLAQGKWVIVGLNHTACTSCNPFHFVVITSANGNDYNLFDPWKGPNISLNSNYGSDYITEIITY